MTRMGLHVWIKWNDDEFSFRHVEVKLSVKCTSGYSDRVFKRVMARDTDLGYSW